MILTCHKADLGDHLEVVIEIPYIPLDDTIGN